MTDVAQAEKVRIDLLTQTAEGLKKLQTVLIADISTAEINGKNSELVKVFLTASRIIEANPSSINDEINKIVSSLPEKNMYFPVAEVLTELSAVGSNILYDGQYLLSVVEKEIEKSSSKLLLSPYPLTRGSAGGSFSISHLALLLLVAAAGVYFYNQYYKEKKDK